MYAADVDSIQFAVDFEHRACEKLKRKDVIDTIAKAVPQPPHKVNLSAPQKTIVVQLVRNACAVGVVDGYKELARLNLRKLADGDDEPTQQQQGKKAASPALASAGKDKGKAVETAAEEASEQKENEAAAGQAADS